MLQLTKYGGFCPLESIDGRFLFYGKVLERGLWRLPLSGGEEERILPDVAASGSAFDVSRQGLYFIGSPNPGTEQKLAFLSFSTGRITPLATINRPVDVGLGVSPDERLVLYTQVERRGSNLMLVENFR